MQEKFEDYQNKAGMLALKKKDQWTLLTKGSGGLAKSKYDSVRIFNNWLTFARNNASQFLIFNSDRKVQFDAAETFTVLTNYSVSFSEEKSSIRFVQVSNPNGDYKLYNGFGKKIFEGQKADIDILTPKLVHVQQKKQQHLIDSSGKFIDIEQVEAFGAYEDGLIPILYKKRFGAIIAQNLEWIPALSQSKLKVFLEGELYVYKEDNLWGLIDASANIVLDAAYTSLEFFNDSTAIVEEEGKFSFLNVHNKRVIHENIDAWEKVVFKDKFYFVLRKEAGYGVIDSEGKEVIPFIFNELHAQKRQGSLYWFAERRLTEIDYVVLAFFDEFGKLLLRQGVAFKDYLETACD